MVWCVFVDLFLILWFAIKLPSPSTSAECLAEKVWFFSLLTGQCMSFLIPLIAAICGYINPRLLLQERFIKFTNRVYMFWIWYSVTIFLLVGFVDLLAQVFVVANMPFNDRFPNDEEVSLNIVVRLFQAFLLVMVLCFCNAYIQIRRRIRRRQEEANKLAKQLKKVKKETWEQNQNKDEEFKAE